MKNESYWLYFNNNEVSPAELDELLADGWRHFGTYFFRDRMGQTEQGFDPILPLRIHLPSFSLKKHQRKIMQKNRDVRIEFRDAFIDPEKEALFHKHKLRFKSNTPESIYNFVSEAPALYPTHIMEIALYDEERLYAVSFLDIGKTATSSVYAFFDPDYGQRSPGIHTLLLEAYFSAEMGKTYQYLGYAHQGNSYYDYKKGFNALEYYDWQGNWLPFEGK